jgi:hypothetical protein
VSYARFCGRDAATAATDGTIAYWDLCTAAGTLDAPKQVMAGHANRRNFVGLSVLHGPAAGVPRSGHMLACGSEDAVVHTYHTMCPSPLATWRLMPAASAPATAASGHGAAFSGSKDEAVVPLRPAGSLQAQPADGSRTAAGAVVRREFVTSVAWAPAGAAASEAPMLAVAASDGEVRVLSLQGGAAY